MSKNANLCTKASDFDHSWPDYIDHQKPELNPCGFVMYVKWNQTN
jgi:hypothetical protein